MTPMPPVPRRLALALLVATAPATAQTVESRASTTGTIDLDAVSVQAARHDARRDDTASRIVFDQDALRRHGDTTLTDALKRLPGITVGTPAPGRSGAIALRGMGSGYTQILVDGRQPPAGFDIESLTPDMVERVEILRAPTADQRGDAIAGTINIVLAGGRSQDGDALTLVLAGTSNGRQLPSASWRHSRQHDNRSDALVATASKRAFLVEEQALERGSTADGVQNVLRTSRLRAEGSRQALSLAPTLDLQLDDVTTLRLQGNAEISRFRRSTDIAWGTLLGPMLQHATYLQRTGIDVDQLQGNARWIRELEDGAGIEAGVHAGGNRERYVFREYGRDVDGQPSLEERTDSALRVHGVGSSGRYTRQAGTRHGLALGWEASLDRRRDARLQAIHFFGQAPDSSSDLEFDASVRRLALYAQDEIAIGPTWSLYLGARGERLETRSDGNGFSAIHHRHQVLSPVLQSLWKPGGDDGDRFRLALGRSFKAPSLASLIPRPYTTTNNRPTNPDEIGNPALRPELATGVDLAWERGSGEGLRLNAGGYLRRIEGVVRTALHQGDDGRWWATPVNGGDATAWGLEVDGGLPLSVLFDDAPAIDLRFNATRAWSRVDDVPGPDNHLPDQTAFSATVAADWRIDARWSGGASYSHRSGGTTRITAARFDLASTARELDLYLLWRTGDRARLRLSASNLLARDIGSGERHVDAGGSLELLRLRRASATFRAQLEIPLR